MSDLLRALRYAGCIAYYEPESDEIEAIRPQAFGEQEARELEQLLARWEETHPGVTVIVTAR